MKNTDHSRDNTKLLVLALVLQKIETNRILTISDIEQYDIIVPITWNMFEHRINKISMRIDQTYSFSSNDVGLNHV